jgi:hypothetical protein
LPLGAGEVMGRKFVRVADFAVIRLQFKFYELVSWFAVHYQFKHNVYEKTSIGNLFDSFAHELKHGRAFCSQLQDVMASCGSMIALAVSCFRKVILKGRGSKMTQFIVRHFETLNAIKITSELNMH